MVEIPLYRYTAKTTTKDLVIPTFRDAPGTARAGCIHAPDGSELYRHNGRSVPKLKVPKPKRPGEYNLLCCDEAVRLAVSVEMGLILDPDALRVFRGRTIVEAP